jgi:hypothetical protein
MNLFVNFKFVLKFVFSQFCFTEVEDSFKWLHSEVCRNPHIVYCIVYAEMWTYNLEIGLMNAETWLLC